MSRLDEIEKNVIEQNLKDDDCYYAEYDDMHYLISSCRELEKAVAFALAELSAAQTEMDKALKALGGRK